MNNKHAFLRTVLGVLGTCAIGFTSPAASAASLRFFGDAIPNVNRVMIRIDPHVPADVGAGDFTLEFWMKAIASENDSNGGCATNSNENWITGNIIFDRAIWTHDMHGDYGLSLFSNGSSGTLAFGMFKSGGSGGAIGLCGSRNVADGQWHHVAVTRAVSSGQIRIYVDGTLDTSGNGPTGNVSYADGVPSSVPPGITLNVDNYLGIGAEKYDADPVRYPSYSGFVDEVRISSSIRAEYTSNFTPPMAPFTPDAQTAALYHFDEGSGNTIVDSAPGGASVGERRFGGTPAGPVWSTDSPFTSTPSPGSLSFAPATYSRAENAGPVTITVVRNGGSSGAASVTYQTVGGTATAGTDYTATSGPLSWADGDSAPKTFSITLMNDAAIESNETITLPLTNVTGAALGTPNTATVTITDDDSAPPPAGTLQFTSSTQSISESASSVTLSVSRTGGSAGAAAVNYQTAGGTATAGADYTTVTNTFQWNAGASNTQSFQIALLGDTAVEGNETINVSLTNASGAALGSPNAATITITDDDSAPPPPPAGTLQFTSSTQTVAESAGSLTLSVSRTAGTSGAASIQYATVAGSAIAATDFTATSGTLSWADGNGNTQSIAVAIANDAQNESAENFTVVLSNATGATLGSVATATITINDDDTAPPPPPPPGGGGGGGSGGSSSGGGGSWSLGWLAVFFAAFAACHFRATSSVRGDTGFAGKTGRLRMA
jgi:hypothetical protein